MSGSSPYVTLTATNDAVAQMIDEPETIDNPDYVEGGTEPRTIANPNYQPMTIDNPVFVSGGTEPEKIDNPDYEPNTFANPDFDSEDINLYIAGESTGTVSVVIADLHNQPMPAGIIVSFKADVGSVVGTSSFTWPSDGSNGGSEYSVAIKGETDAKEGALEITVETPQGLITILRPVRIIIQ